MIVDKEDLGLSLSLGFANNNNNKSPSLPHKPSWIVNDQVLQSSERNSDSSRTETTTNRAFLRGIDVNRIPSNADCEDEAGVSSPNSTISSISGKRSERDDHHHQQQQGNLINVSSDDLHEIERASSRGISDEEDGDTSRKKLRLSKDQSAVLEESFKEHNTLNPKQKLALAKQLGLRPRQVEVWFQNRRARTKLKQTEVDCDFLKRCCENLTEENRRLQKEVQELRALKLSPQFYMQMTPPTTLTMCPSCERVAVPQPPPPPPQSTPPSAVDLRQQMGPTHFRAVPINRWATAAAVQHGHFDVSRRR